MAPKIEYIKNKSQRSLAFMVKLVHFLANNFNYVFKLLRYNNLNADLFNNVGQITSTLEYFNQAKSSPLLFNGG